MQHKPKTRPVPVLQPTSVDCATALETTTGLGTQFCATWLVSQEERAVKLGSLNIIADIATGGKTAAKKQTLASIVIG